MSPDQTQAIQQDAERGNPAFKRAIAWGRLYDAASRLLVAIGYHGERSTRDSEVLLLNEALMTLDNGEHMPGLMPHTDEYAIRQALEAGWRAAIEVHTEHGMAGWSSRKEDALGAIISKKISP